ncbi:MarR family winged helix-turn-helix transcriptional regulator [Gorillibacterium sp. sgz500922]|uniref:MarR family winged helix-turn-helix transcriptional regulator n=1 Tax=Gorillibacterium sp. sgz500922 TaxID=3446694 RepID=UPI003F66AE33
MDKDTLYTPYSDLFRDIGMKIRRLADQRLAELGLNTQQGHIMGYIYEHQDRGVIQKELADHFDRRGATITSMLQGLEKKGYIRRVIPENNERQKNIFLLQKGEDLVEEFNEIFRSVEHRLVGGLSEEERQDLMQLLKKLKASL